MLSATLEKHQWPRKLRKATAPQKRCSYPPLVGYSALTWAARVPLQPSNRCLHLGYRRRRGTRSAPATRKGPSYNQAVTTQTKVLPPKMRRRLRPKFQGNRRGSRAGQIPCEAHVCRRHRASWHWQKHNENYLPGRSNRQHNVDTSKSELLAGCRL